MQDHKIIAIYFHEYIPSRVSEKPILDYYRLLKYADNQEDATSWAYEYVREDFKRRGNENPDLDVIGSYVADHIQYRETLVSECLDTLVKLTERVDSLDRRVSDMEHALGMRNGFARRLE